MMCWLVEVAGGRTALSCDGTPRRVERKLRAGCKKLFCSFPVKCQRRTFLRTFLFHWLTFQKTKSHTRKRTNAAKYSGEEEGTERSVISGRTDKQNTCSHTDVEQSSSRPPRRTPSNLLSHTVKYQVTCSLGPAGFYCPVQFV